MGSIGLLVVGGFLILLALGFSPTKLRVGDREVELERVAAGTLIRVFREADSGTRDDIRDAFGSELTDRGIPVDQAEAVAVMVQRFEKYAGTTAPSELYAAMVSSGWEPTTPPKSTYIRWVYSGAKRTVSLYQNSTYLVAASVDLKEMAKNLAGGEVRPPKNEVSFIYASDPATALDAADQIRGFANGR